MKKIFYLLLLQLIFTNCKNANNPYSDKELASNIDLIDTNNTKNVEINIIDNRIQNSEWNFYRVSENPLVNLNDLTRDEISKEFSKTKIQISDKIVTIGKFCSFEPYVTKKTPLSFFANKKTLNIYKNELSLNGIKLSDSLIVYQSLYPEKECKNPSAEYFETDNTLVFSYQGYLVFFKKGEKPFEENNNCYTKAKITNLPITKDVLNGNNIWNQLSCSIANLDTKDYLRLPNIKDITVFIIGNFNSDDFTYTLVTLKENKVVTKKDIGFAEGAIDGNSIIKFTEFEISKDYVFNLNTKSKKGDNFKTLKVEKFKIDDNGSILIMD